MKTKKLLSFVLTFAMALSMMASMSVTANAAIVAVAKIGTTPYITLDAAISAANSGDTITLGRNTTVCTASETNNYYYINKAITLDLRGNTISTSTANVTMFKIEAGGKLTLTDSSSEQTGKISYTANRTDANAIFHVEGGELVIEKGSYEVTGTTDQKVQCVSILTGTATINNGTFTVNGGHKNSAVVSATKKDSSKNSVLTINNGTFNGSSSVKTFASWKDSNPGYGTVNINGGTFNGTMSTDAHNNIPYVHITGGTFSQNWSKDSSNTTEGDMKNKIALNDILETGYELVAQGTSPETYSVISSNYLDLDSSTSNVKDSKELDQNYNLTVQNGTMPDVTKVKLTWTINDINATRTDDKVWDTEDLCWKTSSSSTTVQDNGTAEFKLENYSSVKVNASVKFKASSTDFNPTVSFDETTGEDGAILIDTANGSNTYSKTNVPSGTISVTVKPGTDDFKKVAATTSATKYGTYTITITEYAPC